MPPFLSITRTPPDEYSNTHVVYDKQRRSPAFWHAIWTTYLALRLFAFCALWLIGMCYIAYVRGSTRVVGHVCCGVFGVMMLLNGMSDVVFNIALSISAGILHAPWFWPPVVAQALVGVMIGIWMLRPTSSVSAQITFARMGGRGVHSGPEAALAAIIGYGSSLGECDPPALVDLAQHAFEPVEVSVTSLRRMGSVLFAPSDELQQARTHWTVRRRHTFSSHGIAGRDKMRVSPEASDQYVVPNVADCYVVHSPKDDASRKFDALCEWVGQFEAEHGRAPVIWLDSLCVDPSFSEVEIFEHMPVYLAQSKRLLLLVTNHGITHLRNAVECYVFRALGGFGSDIEVSIVGASPVRQRRSTSTRTGNDVGGVRAHASSAVSAFDTFHVMYTGTHGETAEMRSRLLYAVELVSVAEINKLVRDTMPSVKATVGEAP